MKKLFIVPALAGALFVAACGGNQSSNGEAETSSEATTTEAAAPAVDVPGLDTVQLSNEIALEASDQMRFDKTLFKVKAGETVKLTLKNVGTMPKESMGHNTVVLQPGTDLAAFAGEAINATDAEYIPLTFASSIVAHTKLLGPGDSDTIEFTLDEAGVYPFICSFPGHYGVMQGQIVAQ